MDNLPAQAIYAVSRLRILRERVYRESLESVAGHLGLSRSYISNIENLHSEPRISTLLMLCRHYRIQLDQLFRGCPSLGGKSRIPGESELIALAKKTLGLTQRHAKAAISKGQTEYLWLAICVCDGEGDEDTLVKYRDWILLESGQYQT